MVQEHVIQALSKSHHAGSKTMVVTANGVRLELTGMACAHWSALKYTMHCVLQHELLCGSYGPDDEETASLKDRAVMLSERLSEAVFSSVLGKAETALLAVNDPPQRLSADWQPAERRTTVKAPEDASSHLLRERASGGTTQGAPHFGDNPLYDQSVGMSNLAIGVEPAQSDTAPFVPRGAPSPAIVNAAHAERSRSDHSDAIDGNLQVSSIITMLGDARAQASDSKPVVGQSPRFAMLPNRQSAVTFSATLPASSPPAASPASPAASTPAQATETAAAESSLATLPPPQAQPATPSFALGARASTNSAALPPRPSYVPSVAPAPVEGGTPPMRATLSSAGLSSHGSQTSVRSAAQLTATRIVHALRAADFLAAVRSSCRSQVHRSQPAATVQGSYDLMARAIGAGCRGGTNKGRFRAAGKRKVECVRRHQLCVEQRARRNWAAAR